MHLQKIYFQVRQFTLDLHQPKTPAFYFPVILLICIIGCHRSEKLKDKELINDPRNINGYVQDNIKAYLSVAMEKDGKVNDSLQVQYSAVIQDFYSDREYQPAWCDTGIWHPQASRLMAYLDTAERDGLFKSDYQYNKIKEIKQSLDADSVKRKDAVIWAKADMLFSDAFMHILADLGQGRLQPDSVSWKHDTARFTRFFRKNLDRFLQGEPLDSVWKQVQPKMPGYALLKNGIKRFVDSMDPKTYTYLTYPYKAGDVKDSTAFIRKLQLRLSESNCIIYSKDALPDSANLADAIKKYQKLKKTTADGKISSALIKSLNLTDREKYNRIAITLDRYKLLPDSMPEKYIWVNLPGYYLQLWDSDTINLTSKIICGKPGTPTPSLTSAISDIVIFPTWTVPESIIKKEMLPALKKSAGYLARKGLQLYTFDGVPVDPSTVNWAKYTKGIPYKIQQGSGNDNALGVIKFNFENPYFVYLHDTNQRYLFKNGMRSLSHGCVRVQEWEKLAFYIIRNDSTKMPTGDTLAYNTDSITNWIANKERHRIPVKNKIPLFIRYFSCEGNNGSIKFYDDIYGEDKRLKEKYFAGK